MCVCAEWGGGFSHIISYLFLIQCTLKRKCSYLDKIAIYRCTRSIQNGSQLQTLRQNDTSFVSVCSPTYHIGPGEFDDKLGVPRDGIGRQAEDTPIILEDDSLLFQGDVLEGQSIKAGD